MVFSQLQPTIHLFVYDSIKNNDKQNQKYKRYVEPLDIYEITSEPTEMYDKTKCPSLNQTIKTTYLPTMNNINYTNNKSNNETNTIVIVVTTIASFIIMIIIIIIYLKYTNYQKYKKNKNKPIFVLDDNFGTDYNHIIDF